MRIIAIIVTDICWWNGVSENDDLVVFLFSWWSNPNHQNFPNFQKNHRSFLDTPKLTFTWLCIQFILLSFYRFFIHIFVLSCQSRESPSRALLQIFWVSYLSTDFGWCGKFFLSELLAFFMTLFHGQSKLFRNSDLPINLLSLKIAWMFQESCENFEKLVCLVLHFVSWLCLDVWLFCVYLETGFV